VGPVIVIHGALLIAVQPQMNGVVKEMKLMPPAALNPSDGLLRDTGQLAAAD